jgi:hypothetical protein
MTHAVDTTDHLHHQRRTHTEAGITPHEVCVKTKKISVDVEDPWRTLNVMETYTLKIQDLPAGLGRDGKPANRKLLASTSQYILLWLACGCEFTRNGVSTSKKRSRTVPDHQAWASHRKGFTILEAHCGRMDTHR